MSGNERPARSMRSAVMSTWGNEDDGFSRWNIWHDPGVGASSRVRQRQPAENSTPHLFFQGRHHPASGVQPLDPAVVFPRCNCTSVFPCGKRAGVGRDLGELDP
eukprot:656981-Rhodomonas_salina.1